MKKIQNFGILFLNCKFEKIETKIENFANKFFYAFSIEPQNWKNPTIKNSSLLQCKLQVIFSKLIDLNFKNKNGKKITSMF